LIRLAGAEACDVEGVSSLSPARSRSEIMREERRGDASRRAGRDPYVVDPAAADASADGALPHGADPCVGGVLIERFVLE
jgi:hypothetical protein